MAQVMAYMVMACVVMAYIVMAYIAGVVLRAGIGTGLYLVELAGGTVSLA